MAARPAAGDRTFYSLADVNAAIGELMTQLNEQRPIRRLGVTRRQLLEEVDRPALKVAAGRAVRVLRMARRAASASTITSRSPPTITASPIVSSAPRSRRG